MVRRIVLLALLLVLSCKKGDPIQQTLDAVADAAEERDTGAVMEYVAPGFENRAEVENQLRRYFFAYQSIDVTVRNVSAERSGNNAWATFRVDFIGLPKTIGGFDQYLPRSAKYRFDVTLEETDGTWLVTSARWEEDRGGA